MLQEKFRALFFWLQFPYNDRIKRYFAIPGPALP